MDNNRTPNNQKKDTNGASPSFTKKVRRSCYDTSFFTLPLRETGWQSAWFITKLVLVIILIQSLVFGYSTLHISKIISENLQNNLPTIHFEEGDLEVEAKTPREVSLYKDFTLLLDPAGKNNRRHLNREVLMVAVNGGLFLRIDGGFQFVSTRHYTNAENKTEFTIDRESLSNWLPWLKKIMIAVVLLSLAFETIILTTARIFLISVGGLLARGNEEKHLPWKQTLKISCYGVTPLVLIRAGLFISGLALPYTDLLLLIGGTLWIYVIVTKLKKSKPSPSEDNIDLLG